MKTLDNELSRLGNGEWQPLCSLNRGTLRLELQKRKGGSRLRVFPSIVINNPALEDGTPSYTVTNYESDYTPTHADINELLAIQEQGIAKYRRNGNQ